MKREFISFVGGPYHGVALPIDPSTADLRLPNLDDREAMFLEALLKEMPRNASSDWPHCYQRDISSSPSVFRFAGEC